MGEIGIVSPDKTRRYPYPVCKKRSVIPVKTTVPGGLLEMLQLFNPLYTGRFFHCCMLDESISHFSGVGSILSLSFYFFYGNSCLQTIHLDQTRLIWVCTVCLSSFYAFPGKNRLSTKKLKQA